jgi:hypothetical protein
MSAWIGPAIIAAVISSLVTVIGWMVAHERDRRTEITRRRERIRDYQTALRAEIRSHRARLARLDLSEHSHLIATKIEVSRGEYTPFVPRESHPSIYNAVLSEIHILPAHVIDPVVLYYTQIRSLTEFAEDLRSKQFQTLDPERKSEMYRDYIGLTAYAVELADGALDAINVSLDADRQ